MTDITENTNPTDAPPQPKLISTIFSCYRTNFALFWRIMMPTIVFGFLFNLGMNLLTALLPERLWHFNTSRGLFISEYPKSTGVHWGMIFDSSFFSIGWLWLTMCPLILAILERRRGIEVTSRSVRHQARNAFCPILAGAFLLVLLAIPGVISFFVLTSKWIDVPDSPYLNAPNFWTVGVALMVKILIQACILPIWAILTTHLYLERADVQSNVIETTELSR